MKCMKMQPLISFLYFLLILVLFYYSLFDFDQSNNILFVSLSNLSIIIETDFFDCQTFEKVWKPIIADIPLYITSFYFFIHYENSFNKTVKRRDNLNKIKSIKWAKVIVSDLPENGYLPLMISSYGLNMYPPRILCYIDAKNYHYNNKKSGQTKDHLSELFNSPKEAKFENYNSPHNFKTVISKWITNSFYKHLNDPNLSSVFGFRTELNNKAVGCDVVMVKEEIIREILFYSKSSINSPSVFLTLSTIDDQKVHNSYDLISDEVIKNVNLNVNQNEVTSQINQRFQCPLKFEGEKKSFTFSVFVPCFKRNYFRHIMKKFDEQILQPSYYVLVQNRHHVLLDVEHKMYKYLRTNKRPIYKIWMINFNSFFVLPNLITSLLDTDFVIRFDDDHVPIFSNLTKSVVDFAVKENLRGDSIIGHRASVLNIRIYAFSRFYNVFCTRNVIDYVASPYIYRPQQMKLSGRVRPFFLAGGEDFQLGLVASIQCGTISLPFNFNIYDYSDDNKKHINDKEIQNYYIEHKFNDLPDYFSHVVYAYYIKIGYMPKCWNKFELLDNEKINDSEYKHKLFF